MILDKIGYSYNDLKIVPSVISDVDSRSQCNPYREDQMLPIFASCMSTVVDTKNYEIFKENKIHPIIPRNIDLVGRQALMNDGEWVALSLNEFKEMFCESTQKPGQTYKICIDVANGHMKSLYNYCKKAKLNAIDNDYQLIIMTGNIANPETYNWICQNGMIFNTKSNKQEICIDYIRLSIGTGSECFIDGTKILMANNTYKNIEDINIGDEIKNISGNTNKVCMTTRFKSHKPLIKINNEIVSTEDHQYLVINKSDQQFINDNNLMEYAYYVQANQLNPDKHLLIQYEPD